MGFDPRKLNCVFSLKQTELAAGRGRIAAFVNALAQDLKQAVFTPEHTRDYHARNEEGSR